jgi:hypothetical protein
MTKPPRVSTVYLGQFSSQRAEAIAEAFEDAGIDWWHKQAGAITRFFFAGEWGVRLFVDEERLEEAREIARRVSSERG